MRKHFWIGLGLMVGSMLFASCHREERRFRKPAASTAPEGTVRLSELRPGPQVPDVPGADKQGYGSNAYAISEGQQLFHWYNCDGCHAHGGGAIGPPLMDQKWIYGSAPENIFVTIVEGRPNGMPSFRGKIPDYKVWQLVAYVRSLSSQTSPFSIAPRADAMSATPPGNLQAKKPPVSQGVEHLP